MEKFRKYFFTGMLGFAVIMLSATSCSKKTTMRGKPKKGKTPCPIKDCSIDNLEYLKKV
ncbi:MAG: hypothetical protein ACI85I_000896 [Arenicella sp.]|jgi:hypothetical protein